jgi:2-methylisocitrate lyase-like PEP mutase family enzyme
VVPGAANALTAKLIERTGFEAIYLTGAGIANTFYGIPDLGLVSLDILVAHTEAVAEAVTLPVIVDADTGFGNAIGVRRTVERLERAGAAAIQLEDQCSPKRCGHFSGTEVIPIGEAVAKIAAAVDARRDDDLAIIARTDALASEGLEGALKRARRFVDVGADAVFIEAPPSKEMLLALPRALPRVPLVANMVLGGRTPTLPLEELRGFAIVLFANAALQASIVGIRTVLGELAANGSLAETSQGIATFAERQALVDKERFDTLERHYRELEDRT